jgi:hypothetical protein
VAPHPIAAATARGYGGDVRRLICSLIVAAGLLALLPVGGAMAASNGKCKAPTGTREPITHLRAGYATSCATAKKVAKGWDNQCQPFETLCFAKVAGNRWSCRATNYDQPGYRSQLFLKCALKETTRGRPSVNFRQTGVIHHCADPQGTRHPIAGVTGYYAVGCGRALAVARAWDSACDTGDGSSSCAAEAAGRRWTCTELGRPGVDPSYGYYCAAAGDATRVIFSVAVPLFPPGQSGTDVQPDDE